MANCLHCGDKIPDRPNGARGPAPKYCQKVTCNAQYRERGEIKDFRISRAHHGWTKYGSGNKNLTIKKPFDWHCQACGRSQPKEFPGYPFQVGVNFREFIRVCANCFNISKRRRVKRYVTLIRVVRGQLVK